MAGFVSQSSDSSDRVEPGSPSDAASGIDCDVEFSEQQSLTNSDDSEEVEQQSIPQDSQEAEQQSKVNPHDDSGVDLLLSSRLSPITNAEALKETILEQQTIVTEFDPADTHSCAEDADSGQQGVRVFTPRKFSFLELLNSDDAECLNTDWSELGAPSDAAPSDAAANEAEKRIPDHSNDDWKEWFIDSEGDV